MLSSGRLASIAFVTVTALATAVTTILPAGCADQPTEATPNRCTPGNYVFCRCRDRQEGSKLCLDDGQNFGPCEPCETAENPEEEIPGPLEEAGPPQPAATCGNGQVEANEDCDDKNTEPSDGCDKCKLVGKEPVASRTCPGLDVHVWGGEHAPTIVVTTVGSGTHQTPAGQRICGSDTGNVPTTGAVGTDRAFKVVPHRGGTLVVVTTETAFNNYLYATTVCQNQSDIDYVACANKNGGAGGEELRVAVEANKPIYVFLDGAGIDPGEAAGEARVTFAIE